MIGALAAGLMLVPMAQTTTSAEAGALVSTMLRRYAEAQTLIGRIRWTQTANRVAVVTETEMQFERPSKLFIRQVRRSSEPRTWLVTSDGKTFSYNKPDDLFGSFGRLVEPVQAGARVQRLQELYAAVYKSLGDKSAPLDIAIGRREDLETLRFQWATVSVLGKEIIRNIECTVVGGQWRESSSTQPGGTFRLWITPQGDLMQVSQREFFTVPGQRNLDPIEVVSVWEVDLKVNGTVDPKLFAVVR